MSDTPKPRRGPPKLVVPAAKQDYKLSNSGTFTEEGLVINKNGMKLAEGLIEKQVKEHAKRTGSKHKKPADVPVSEQDAMFWEVATINDLELLAPLGRGASGSVKKVRHIPSNRILAVKVIPMEVNAKVRRQILLELRTLHGSRCDNIVRYHGAFYKDGAFFLVLELMDGGSLADLVKIAHDNHVKIPEPVIGHITRQILLGLDYMNRDMNLLHRDIKPANVLINRAGQCKISDLGLVSQLTNSVGQAATFVGTILYMSPERIQGQQYSYACDVWSVGLTVIELAQGQYPYDTANAKFFDIFNSIVRDEPPVLPAGEFSPELCDFVASCLIKDPHARPNSGILLNHPFIKKYENDSFDLSGWMTNFLDSYKAAPPADTPAADA